MKHLDEHVIELHVLGSPTAEDRRGEVERHLAECHGCRALAGEMERFYADFGAAMTSGRAPEPAASRALTRSPRALEPWYEPYAPAAPRPRPSPAVRFGRFVRNHPAAATGMGSFGLAAAILGLALLRPGGTTDPNPDYPHVNPAAGTLEIYNRGHRKLWELPSNQLYQAPHDFIKSTEAITVIRDIDGDGLNELITGLPFGSQRTDPSPLTVYSHDGTVRFEKFFSSTIEFRGRKYDDVQGVERLAVGSFGGRKEQEIFALTSRGRSPNVTCRISKDGAILGEYFHFGTADLDIVRWPGGGREYLAFLGQNNVDEPDSLSYAVLILLDPLKLAGRAEASESRGFGLPVSQAEEYIVRFPLTDINRVLHTPAQVGFTRVTTSGGASRLEVMIRGNYSDASIRMGGGPGFYCYFTPGMEVVDAKFESVTMRLRQLLVAQGKLPPRSAEDWLAELKAGVRYWNGSGWQEEATPVRRPAGS